MIEDKNNIQGEDDGSLAFLRIPRDESNRSFNCDETTQSKLVNTTFWIVDFIEDVPTRFSKSKGTKGQTLVKIKMSKDDPESNAKKFFTGSADILYHISAGTVDYTGGEEVRANLLKGRSSAKPEAHKSLAYG